MGGLTQQGEAIVGARTDVHSSRHADSSLSAAVFRNDVALWTIVLLAVALRLSSALPFSVHHADEIWQYLEPAHRLIEGRSVVTWDQRDGLRSWLLPELLSVPMYIGRWLSPATQAPLLAARLFVAALSLLCVLAAYRLGSAISQLHGLFAAFVAAIWAEFVYLAPHALTEAVSAWFFVAGAAVLLTSHGRKDYRAGFLLGLSFVIRIQTAPALAVVVLMNLGDWRSRLPRLIAGGLAALVIDSVANLLAGAPPLFWIHNNFVVNVIHGKAATFGVEPAWYYAWNLLGRWGALLFPLLAFAFWGARRYPSLLAAALAHIAVHSMIDHKEWRFDFLFHVLIIVLAGIGTVDLVQRLPRRLSLPIAVFAWIAASTFVATTPAMRMNSQNYVQMAAALENAGKIAPSCSIALYRSQDQLGAAFVLVGKDRDIFTFRGSHSQASLRRSATAIGAIVTGAGREGELPPGFPDKTCYPGSNGLSYWCVFKRSGQCSGRPPPGREINRWLVAVGR